MDAISATLNALTLPAPTAVTERRGEVGATAREGRTR